MKKLLASAIAIIFLSAGLSSAQSALSFGTNNTTTYVTFGNKPALGLSQFTLECWFKRTGTGVTASTGTGGITAAIPLVTKGTSEADGSTVDCNYFMGINTTGNKLCADFEEGAGGTTPGLNHPISGNTTIVNNVWYHAAATYDGSTWKLYLNGLLEATLVVNQPCQNLSIQHSSIGSSIRSNGTTAQGFFAGVMDEVRIWNSARTISQIQTTINSQISTPQSGMVARWGLNENTGTSIGDISGNVLTGTITGTNFTWTTSVAPFNLTFAGTNFASTITANSPASGNKCLDAPAVNLSVTVNDQNVSDVLSVKFYGRPKKTTPPDFTLIGLPDTQFYTEETNGGNNSTFKAQTNWIVANKNLLNIVHVAQLGDCVQNGDNGGNDVEWKRADTSMKIIENPLTTGLPEGLPYTMNVGNHDQSPGGDASGTTTFFNQYFGTARFSGRSYWGGNFGANADNSYQLFSVNGTDFLVVSLEYDPTANASVIAWANSLLQTYSTRKAIIVSHWIINADGTFGAQGQAIYNALKGNSNLYLMLCGHINPNGEARRADTFNGNTVNTLLSDYQDINGGNGWLRIMTFSPSNNTLSVKTYSPTLNQYQTDANSEFTLTNMNLFTDTTAYQLLSTQSATGSGTLNYSWNTLLTDSMYEWYATVADTQFTVSTTTSNFGTYSKPVVALGSDIAEQCDQLQTLNAGNPGKTYLWSTGAATQSITPNTSGTYSVTVTNPVSGCFSSDTIQVTITGNPSVSITPNITSTCSGGTASLTATAGLSSYAWSTGATADAIIVTNPGTYTVTVTNVAGCTATASQLVAFSPQLSVNAAATNVSCFGGITGAVNITVTGSAIPFTYLWSNGATTQNITGVAANTYTVTVTDNGGCTANASATVTQPAALSLTAPTITTTNGGYNGTIKANPTGGTSPYTYVWRYNNAGANITTQTLSTTHVGGIYTVTVTDNKGCTVAATYSHAVPTVSGATVLLPWNATWKYKDDGSNQGTAWKGTSFDDSTWPSAVAEFGYGDGDETTLINACGTVVQTPSCSTKYITTYFRKTINITDVTPFQSIKFNAFRDDGIVVHVNNNEVYRSNMPTGTIINTTGASTGVSDDGETLQTQTVAVASSFLVTGNNTIAVEVHQQVGTSSDVTFNMEILAVPPVPEVLTRGPYLQKLTPSAITIKWSTDVAVKSKISYGTDSLALTNSVADNNNVTSHTVTLTGLTPYTKYYYSVGSPTLTLQGNGQNFFITSPLPGTAGKYNFWLVGDCGNNSTNQAQVRDKYNAYMGTTPTNAWLLLGDNAYSNGADAEYQAEFFNVYQGSIMKNAPLYPTPGNHDYNNGNATNQDDHNVPYYTIFDMPSNGEAGGVASGKKEYYSYDYGNVHFLSLDSYGEESNLRLYDTLGAQVQWIKQDLAANTNKQFIVAYWHHPPYTMGSHNSDTESELTQMHTKFIRILERYGVDLIVCGHSHEYERSKLMMGHYGNETSFDSNVHNVSQSSGRYDGTTNSCTYVKDSIHGYNGTIYVVSGSAGQLDANVQAAWPHNAMTGYFNQTNGGSALLTVESNRLDLKWICADGVVRDQFTLIKDANKVRNYTINYGDSLALTASWIGQYTWSQSSATSRSVNVAPMVDTTYVATDQYQCVTDTFKVSVTMPGLSLSSPPTAICSGSFIKLPYTAAGHYNAGNTFTTQLSDASGNFTNAVIIGSVVSTVSDSVIVTIPANTPVGNNYRIRIVSSSPLITSAETSPVIISGIAVSLISNDADNTICEGDEITLTASGADTYEFFVNGLSQGAAGASNVFNSTLLPAGQVSVTATGYNNCGSNTGTNIINVNPLPVATINVNGSTNFCASDSVQLTATNNMVSYLWSNGATTQIITVDTAGTFSVTVTNGNGCQATAIISTTVYALPSDFDQNGVTENEDFLQLLGVFNQFCSCPQDINGNGIVNNVDFLQLLGQFNQTCE